MRRFFWCLEIFFFFSFLRTDERREAVLWGVFERKQKKRKQKKTEVKTLTEMMLFSEESLQGMKKIMQKKHVQTHEQIST